MTWVADASFFGGLWLTAYALGGTFLAGVVLFSSVVVLGFIGAWVNGGR